MSSKELEKTVAEIGKTLQRHDKDLGTIFATLTEQGQTSTGGSTKKGKGGGEVPIYRCRGKECTFSTDKIEDYIPHVVEEQLESAMDKLRQQREKTAAAQEAPEAATRKHGGTVKDYLDCPECYPKFEKGLLEHPKFQETLSKMQGEQKKKGGVDLP